MSYEALETFARSQQVPDRNVLRAEVSEDDLEEEAAKIRADV